MRIYNIRLRETAIGIVPFEVSRDFDVDKFIKEHRVININKASLEDLVKIPGIGPALAHRILEYRTNEGMFSTIEDMKKVKGIGDKKFEEMKDYITTE